ncbi:hypothetical protein Hanom_Chr16g01420841 [Helianthus anomalus]
MNQEIRRMVLISGKSVINRSNIGQISDNISDIIGTDILTNILYRYLGKGPITDTSLFFFERPTNPPNGILTKFTTSGYTRLRTEENPHLGHKPVNTRTKARQCGEVKLIQFKDRTSDRRLLA